MEFASPELDIGNTVRLKKPATESDGRIFEFGIIVQHVGFNYRGIPKVCLNLYSDSGEILIAESNIPVGADYVASEFLTWHLARFAGKSVNGVFNYGYAVLCNGVGFDMYPLCTGCGDQDQHPFAEVESTICPQCEGWGHEKHMRRLADMQN